MKFVKISHWYNEGSWISVFLLFVAFFSLAQADSSSDVSKMAADDFAVEHGINKSQETPRVLFVGSTCRQMTVFDIDNLDGSADFNQSDIKTEPCIFDFYLNETVYHTFTYGTIVSFPKVFFKWQTPAYRNSKNKLNDIFDIAVDYMNKKLYVITVRNKIESDKLLVIDIASGNTGIVITDLHLPKHIEVDPSSGLLFIQQQSSILRANMDGTSQVKVIEKQGVSRMTIDRKSMRLFWATSTTIESSSYYDNDHRILARIDRPVRDLAVLGEKLFWLSTPNGLMQLDTRISYCKIFNSYFCDRDTTSTLPFKNPQTMKAYDFGERQNIVKRKVNPCYDIHPSCEHICLLRKNGCSCACKVGYKLRSDMYTCQLAYDKFLLYVQDNYAKGRIVGSKTNDSSNFVDAIYPNMLESEANFVSFDYDYQDNSIYFTDNSPGNNKLYVKKIDASKRQFPLHSYDHIEVCATAVDWVSKNVYQLVRNTRNSYMSVMAHHFREIKDGNTIIAYSKDVINLPKDYQAGSILVHPLRGFLFITTREDFESQWHIYRANMDGTNLRNCVDRTSHYGMAIDFEQDLVYYFNDNRTVLMNFHINCTVGTKKIDVTAMTNATGVIIDDNDVYVNNLTTIWRFDKNIEGYPIKMVESAEINQPRTIIGAKIYAESAQPISNEHPCAIHNGGCQKFCFPVPSEERLFEFEKPRLRRQCGCEERETLRLDGLSCGFPLPVA